MDKNGKHLKTVLYNLKKYLWIFILPDRFDFFSWTNFSCSFWKSPRKVLETHSYKYVILVDGNTEIFFFKTAVKLHHTRLHHTLSIMPSIFPSSTLFLIVWAVPTTDSEIFLVALVAKLKIYSANEEEEGKTWLVCGNNVKGANNTKAERCVTGSTISAFTQTELIIKKGNEKLTHSWDKICPAAVTSVISAEGDPF